MEVNFKKNGIEVNGIFFLLEDIIKGCIEKKIEEENLGLMLIEWGRERNFDGVLEEFIAPIKDLEILEQILLDKHIYFGEIAGKHSNVNGTIDSEEIAIIENEEIIRDFLILNPTGHKYDYSFLSRFNDGLLDEIYENISELEKKEFERIYKKIGTYND